MPEGVHRVTGCGTPCSGLVDKVGIGPRLESILEVFSNLRGSVLCHTA